MKNKLIKLLFLLTLVFVIFAGCANEKAAAPKNDNSATEENVQKETPSDGAKYADVEVYEKKGVPHAKTDDGQEVEISGENLQALIEEYQKVQGTGSREEKNLLNKIQLILEAPKE